MESSRTPRPPTDVEEALSSMLWTPYPQDSDTSSSDDSDSTITVSQKKRPLTWACPNEELFTITDRFPPYYVSPPTYLTTYHEIRPSQPQHQSSTQIGNYLDGGYSHMVHSLSDTFLHNQVN